MQPAFLLSFRDTVTASDANDDRFILSAPNLNLDMGQFSPGIRSAIRSLLDEEATEEELSDIVLQQEEMSALPQLFYLLQQLTNIGLICQTLKLEGEPMATIVPIAVPYSLEWEQVEPDREYVLSRFACARQEGENLVIESPLAKARLHIADWRAIAFWGLLATPQKIDSIASLVPSLSMEIATALASLFLSVKIFEEVTETGTAIEDTNNTLRSWEFHDLLFHARSRIGRTSQAVGKSYRFLNDFPPLPAIKPMSASETIALYKPDLDRLNERDIPFSQVLERRRSWREFDNDRPISLQQLGEFLYRSARVRSIGRDAKYEYTNRPYPTGGAAYELEIYLVVDLCQDLPFGLYHYCPQNHHLTKICDRTPEVEGLADTMRRSTPGYNPMQVSFFYAARFQRVSWAYEAIAYSLILKNVGVLQQTMYLVAEAMDLAGCAIGTGNSDLFAAAAGTDYYAETSVGEFILGSKLKVADSR